MNATYAINTEKNGIEITFDSKPAAAVLETIKAAGYRWSRARRLWWAKQSPTAIEAAQAVAEGRMEAPAAQDTTPAPDLWERTRWTPGPGGDERHAHTVGSNYKRGLSNKEIAATVKRHLVQRFPGTKWSATTQGYNSIDLYLKSSPYHNERHYQNRQEWEEASPEIAAIINYAEKLLSSYNYNDSDTMTDYFDVNFYDSVGVAYDYQQTEPTEAQRAEIETFRARLEEEKRKEEERQEQEWREEQARQAEREKEFARREAEAQAIIKELSAAATVRTLDPSDQYIIPAVPLARKAGDVEEAREAAAEGAVDVADCIVLEEITAPAELLNKWGTAALLDDVPELLRGIGGSRTYDPRVTTMTDYHQMDQAERQTVKWYTLAAAIYTDNGELWAVVDDEGYHYAWYIAAAPWEGSARRLPLPQDQEPDSEIRAHAERVEDTSTTIIERLGLTGGGWETSPEYAQEMEPIMKGITVDTIRAVKVEPLKAWLYRRQDQRQQIREQLTRASIPAGARVTIIKESGFGGISATVATWDHWEACTYAQYTDAAKIIVKPKGKRGLYSMTLHRGPAVLIVLGEVEIPESVLWDVETTSTGVTIKKSRFTSCDPDAMQAVREYIQSTGARVYVDAKGGY